MAADYGRRRKARGAIFHQAEMGSAWAGSPSLVAVTYKTEQGRDFSKAIAIYDSCAYRQRDGGRGMSVTGEPICFTVPDEPVAKGRARSTKSGRHYTPEKTVRYERTVALFASQAMAQRESMLFGPLALEIVATFAWPLSWPAKKRARSQYKVSKPDLDNLAKACADAMNGVVYLDDAAIVLLSVTKVYGETPGMSVCVKELGA